MRSLRKAVAYVDQVARFSSTAQPASLLELRRYTLQPAGFKAFMQMSAQTAGLRSALNPAFRAFFTCDTGGSLNTVTHLYAYESLAQRTETRRRLAASASWQEYVDASRCFVAAQESSLLLEAPDCHAAAGAVPVAQYRSPPAAAEPAVYELRTYQLILGYNPVPQLRAALVDGLPSKVAADREGSLALMCYSDVGLLNTFVEVWRYPSAAACISAREAARRAPEWRAAIAKVAPMVTSFSTQFLQPAAFSPWQ